MTINPIEAAKSVLENGAQEFDGILLDAFTASAMLQIHGALSATNQAKMQTMSLTKAATITWKLAERMSK